MKPDKNIIVNETLIINYLSGEASPEEAMAIEKWSKQPGNKKEFDELFKTWNILSTQRQFTNPDKEIAWNRLQAGISTQPAARVFNLKRWLIAAAAILLILITAFLFTYNQQGNYGKHSTIVQITAGNEIMHKLLPDSSSVTLTKYSSIKYSPTFNAKNREVWLQGEAYFIVTPNKTLPFKIHDSDLTVEVVGTKFNISNNKQANEIKVQVHSGTVSLYNGERKIFVPKGKTGIYNIADKKLSLENKVDDNSMGYATKNFNFNNTSLAEVAALLEKAFNVKVVFKNAELQNCTITARFQNESLDYILQIIGITLNISCSNKNNTILIDGKACN